MRHLNKIFFINSANIQFAEVLLDGNVHFSGTQGVGKSTILRALLFFYNADKMRLGIQSGQKSFEDFYFKFSNSYIVYEVKTDSGAYSILASRSNGKIAYRFIDSSFKKDWIIDEHGHATSDWIKIRDRIGNDIDISPKIDTYELYRDIIFGNTHDRGHRFDKYALARSAKYQNIPRSIQNVFLNSKLDADFVKNTIIQSMSETEEAFNLSTYRHLVMNFEREFNEIDCWYKKDKSGNNPVRSKAQRAIDTYLLLIALESEIINTWHKINYQVDFTRNELPTIEEEIFHIESEQKRIGGLIYTLRNEYEQNHDHLTKEITECVVRLSDIKKKRNHYDQINIESIITFVDQEELFRLDLQQKQDGLSILLKEFDDISEKYKILYDSLEREIEVFRSLQKEELQKVRESVFEKKQEALSLSTNRKQAKEKAYTEWKENNDKRLYELREELGNAEKHIASLKYWRPLEEKIISCKNEIDKLTKEEEILTTQIKLKDIELQSLSKDFEHEYEKKESEQRLIQHDIESNLERIKLNLTKINEKLTQFNGSFYEWLVVNKPGWEENIGKIVDEENVLYASDLNPELEDGVSLFGVKIDVNSIPIHHRTPDEYRVQKEELEKAIDFENKKYIDEQKKHENILADIKKKFRTERDKIDKEIKTLKYRLGLIPHKKRDINTKLRQLQDEETNIRLKEKEKYNVICNNKRILIAKEEQERKRQFESYNSEIKCIDIEFSETKSKLDKELELFKDGQDRKARIKNDEYSKRKKEIKQREQDELQGKGADTSAIDTYRNAIKNIEESLRKIEDSKPIVYGYNKDNDELFSHESEYLDKKASLEKEDSQLRENHEIQHNKFVSKQDELRDSLSVKKDKRDTILNGLSQYENFCKIEKDTLPSTLFDDEFEETDLTCKELVDDICAKINKKRQTEQQLKQAINAFNSHFGTDNIFKFVTPQDEEDYKSYAINLKEFIDDDKIETYRVRISDHYNEILSKLSRDVSLLMNHSAEIKSIINDVNRDFRERNFAGVIRSIELRTEESSDRLMQTLQSIRDFTDENSLSIGQENLFSDDNHSIINNEIVKLFKQFVIHLQKDPNRTELTVSDTFRLQFRIQENDNNTGWVERISNIGSDGTDILVKAMINIMLINVFKTKAARKDGDFIIHCMMDEIGKLHPSNIAGILQFANARNIYLINSSPMSYNADIYKYNYLLTKDNQSRTFVKRLISVNLS